MQFIARFSPIRAYQDLRLFLAERRPYELGFLVLAMAITGFLVWAFVKDSYTPHVYRPTIIYVQQWTLDRTDAEIRAAQKVDQAAKDKRLAAEKIETDKRRAEFKKLDDQMTKWGPLSDARWIGAALALAERGRGRTAPNPAVGCVIVAGGRVVGRGWTRPGGRPHAEAMALAEAGAKSRGATCYVTLEPCAHRSPRGPACADLLIEAGVARVVAAIGDPDPRTDGVGLATLREAGIETICGMREAEARRSMAGFLSRQAMGRPHVTLKLATSLDGCIAMADGTSRWITGTEARAHAHLERSRHEAILIGRGTHDIDAPVLDVRLPGLESRTPRRLLLSTRDAADGWERIASPAAIAALTGIDHLLVEGGARTAAAFLAADLVDRLLLYRAPILIGAGKPALGDIGLTDLAAAHGRFRLVDSRMLGSDRLEVYERG